MSLYSPSVCYNEPLLRGQVKSKKFQLLELLEPLESLERLTAQAVGTVQSDGTVTSAQAAGTVQAVETVCLKEGACMKMKKDAVSKAGSVDAVYSGIKKILEEARSRAYRAVNFAMVQAYWNIGRVIVEEEQKGKTKADYGQSLIQELAKRLTREYGKGFTQTNLWYMRQFFMIFPILHALRGELTWTHYRLLFKVEKENARNFYLNEAAEAGWSLVVSGLQISEFP